MKKALLGTTALAVAGGLTISDAKAETSLAISGFNNHAFVIHDSSYDESQPGTTALEDPDNSAGLSMYNTAEINFFATTKLENGLTVVSRIEMESSASDDVNTDEVQVHFNGGFGQIQVGGIDVANEVLHYNPGSASLFGLSASSYATYLGLTVNGQLTDLSPNLGADDDLGIAYYSPRMMGFQWGISYSPNVAQANVINTDNTATDFVGTGLNYQTEIDGIGLNASVSYAQVDGGFAAGTAAMPNMARTLHWGVNATMGNFGAGVSMSHNGGSLGNQTVSQDSNIMLAGVNYGTGPWSVSYNYLHGNARGTVDGAAENQNEMLDWHEFAASYDMGSGVSLGASALLSFYEGETAESGITGDDTEGFAATTWLGVSF